MLSGSKVRNLRNEETMFVTVEEEEALLLHDKWTFRADKHAD